MSLDLHQLASQLEEMAFLLKAGQEERKARLQTALETFGSRAADWVSLRKKVSESNTTWLVAGLIEGLGVRYAPPATPGEFAVVATDGSHIDVDPHGPARCCLINIGSAVLRYGEAPAAILESHPALHAGEEEMALLEPLGSGRETLAGALLGVKRSVEECRALAELVENSPHPIPSLALLDGSLILWGLAGPSQPDYVLEELLHKGFLKALDRVREAGKERKVALASYISRSRSTDVVNVLRLALCPHEPADCDRHCSDVRASDKRECDGVAGVQDRDLFASLLDLGERSATFVSGSRFMRRHYGEHEVCFFYLRAEEEIARVELPCWVADDEGLLNLVHALVLDQCRRGQGYPVALAEAHEKAVLTGADREQFWLMVERFLWEERLPAATSAKSRSKRTRWI